MNDSLGLYLSVPFCKAKCSFCNFASDVFAPGRMDAYVDRLCAELSEARSLATRREAHLPARVDTVYFGGGTPSLLEPRHLRLLFAAIRGQFQLAADAEVTLEAAPGQLAEPTLAAAMELGVNRISFGVQSFVDAESAAVGRLHRREECVAEIARTRRAGVRQVSLDLIAGLPHQTTESWAFSLGHAVESGVDHVSIYLLEIDEESRLGREALAGGDRYHAPALPSDDEAADWYGAACTRLEEAGLFQYEISNFARPGSASRHNLKYWQRSPYLGLGLDAHSMLPAPGGIALRWANPDDFDGYMASAMPAGVLNDGALNVLPRKQAASRVDRIDPDAAFEEELFLGLRLNAGVDLERLSAMYGPQRTHRVHEPLSLAQAAGLVEWTHANVRLTASGRLASNEVFSRLLSA